MRCVCEMEGGKGTCASDPGGCERRGVLALHFFSFVP